MLQLKFTKNIYNDKVCLENIFEVDNTKKFAVKQTERYWLDKTYNARTK